MIEKHRPWPMEWDPDRATMSSTERLNLANSLIREVALDLGLGIMSFESSWLAVKLSSLPNFTSQSGPPLCNNQYRFTLFKSTSAILIVIRNTPHLMIDVLD